MKIHKYENYEAYVEAQTKANIERHKNMLNEVSKVKILKDIKAFGYNLVL